MNDPLGFQDAKVVVTGAASGMGAAAAEILVSLGAMVTAIDIKKPDAAVTEFMEVDLRDPGAISDAANAIAGPIDSVFSCAGLPGPPFAELDVIVVNFVGARHLIESLVPSLREGSSVGCISSSGAIGWQNHLEISLALLAHDTFEGQVEWLKANEEKWGYSGYLWSKYLLDAWVGWRGADLIKQGIRLNAINPGPTDTPMMPQFIDFAGEEAIDSAMGPIGRRSRPEEQAWPLVLLNSPRMSYVSGEVLWVDGGFQGATLTGRMGGFTDLSGLEGL